MKLKLIRCTTCGEDWTVAPEIEPVYDRYVCPLCREELDYEDNMMDGPYEEDERA